MSQRKTPPLMTETIYNVSKSKRKRIVVATLAIVVIVALGAVILWITQNMVMSAN